MHKINKKEPLQAFADYVKRQKPQRWEDLSPEIDYSFRLQMLFDEQDCLCGYTEIPLEEDSSSSHIDHFVKREHDSKKIFDWNNLIVSTVDEDYGGKYKDNKYGIKRNGYSKIFNPVMEDMSQYIEYDNDGEMMVKGSVDEQNKQKVVETIKAFNLNHKSLCERRKDIIRDLSTYYNQGMLGNPIVKSAFRNRGFISLWNWYTQNPV